MSVCIGDGVPRWGTSIGECLAWRQYAEMGGGVALVSVWLGDGVPKWGASIGECMTRGWNAERGYIGVCMA